MRCSLFIGTSSVPRSVAGVDLRDTDSPNVNMSARKRDASGSMRARYTALRSHTATVWVMDIEWYEVINNFLTDISGILF